MRRIKSASAHVSRQQGGRGSTVAIPASAPVNPPAYTAAAEAASHFHVMTSPTAAMPLHERVRLAVSPPRNHHERRVSAPTCRATTSSTKTPDRRLRNSVGDLTSFRSFENANSSAHHAVSRLLEERIRGSPGAGASPGGVQAVLDGDSLSAADHVQQLLNRLSALSSAASTPPPKNDDPLPSSPVCPSPLPSSVPMSPDKSPRHPECTSPVAMVASARGVFEPRPASDRRRSSARLGRTICDLSASSTPPEQASPQQPNPASHVPLEPLPQFTAEPVSSAVDDNPSQPPPPQSRVTFHSTATPFAGTRASTAGAGSTRPLTGTTTSPRAVVAGGLSPAEWLALQAPCAATHQSRTAPMALLSPDCAPSLWQRQYSSGLTVTSCRPHTAAPQSTHPHHPPDANPLPPSQSRTTSALAIGVPSSTQRAREARAAFRRRLRPQTTGRPGFGPLFTDSARVLAVPTAATTEPAPVQRPATAAPSRRRTRAVRSPRGADVQVSMNAFVPRMPHLRSEFSASTSQGLVNK